MSESEVAKVLAQAVERGLIVGFSRQRKGWRIGDRRSSRTLTRAEATRFARRMKERL
jgi:hypothetical protein